MGDLLIAIVLLLVPSETQSENASEKQVSPCNENKELWDALIRCASAHSHQCFQRISQIVEEDSRTGLNELASVLLEEWDINMTEHNLASPRHIWSPQLTMEEIKSIVPEKIEWTFIVIRGKVDCRGRVHDPWILRPSKYEDLNEEIVKIFSSSCYRPALNISGFVAAETTFSFRLEPR